MLAGWKKKSNLSSNEVSTAVWIQQLRLCCRKRSSGFWMTRQRKQFGMRYLKVESEVFEYNAWDNVEWSLEQEEEARNKIANQKDSPVASQEAECLLRNPAEQWNTFYQTHKNKFFMDRNWLLTEFPELDVKCRESDDPLLVLDVGCGVGNATIPLLQTSEQSGKMFVYACDYSQQAVDILKQTTSQWSDRCKPFLWDITGQITETIPPRSLDILLCIYVLSALPPEKQQQAVINLTSLLKPGGALLLKDYAQFDMTQLRFKKNRLIDENFYRRGDGTLVYFFTQKELDRLFNGVGLKQETNVLDRRLIVNRAKRVKMYRMWVQCKYVKNV
uniref:tRNA N(3)-methylcytidine methyltransferase n=1 Tax=Setaria digitata TaxID=48799 RepID=A0A915Q6K4_9BILA